jgi:ribonuclease VapC
MQEREPEKSLGTPNRERAGRPSPRGSGGGTEPRANPALGAVLDASALLALLFAEPGAEVVADVIAGGAAISAVNLSEVATVLVRRDQDHGRILAPVCEQVVVEPFTAADALSAAAFYAQTTATGLSLGDRACLALAKRLNATAVTAEHAWSALNLSINVQLIRARANGDP